MTQLFTSARFAIRLSDGCNNAKRCRKPSVFACLSYFFLSGFSHLNSENSAIDIATSIVFAGSPYRPSVNMGRKRKSRRLSRPGKRRFSGNQFCSTTRFSSHSQAESSAEKEQPLTSGDATSASAHKLKFVLSALALPTPNPQKPTPSPQKPTPSPQKLTTPSPGTILTTATVIAVSLAVRRMILMNWPSAVFDW